ncbi:glutathione s-transferas-like protein [Aaosphaeria arxii CBS 175.79]|uniref:Glutathione s-transferas-like protein n=1 Tax=Aaosphaeria arxii CBS 175.79 TaxID=1450172 RepID=A0A6A5XLP4_9PLEO|nr:glutathione s-transferas-like protein [Aaosphaeria arxii CBS 175.79]KAF2014082.1 glutathione s-transferas-like protein [Aaosphaeria arxii CBS 175.79]
MALKVYCDPCTINSRKVLAALQQMNADYEIQYVDYFAGEHKSDEFKKINPHATVPAATDGPNLTLTESNAILQYVADTTGAETMYPKDLKKRAIINRWLLWEASAWFPCCYVYVIENFVKPSFFKQQPEQKALDAEAPKFHRYAHVLNEQLGRTKWLTSDTDVTIADFAVAAPLHLYTASKIPLDKYPNLKRWMTEGIEQLAGWEKTQGAVDKVFPRQDD